MELSRAFELHKFNAQVDQMTEQQAKDMLKTVYKAYIVQKETYVQLVGQSWGILPEQLG